MLGQLTGEDEADGSLDLPGRDGGLLVVSSQLGGLSSDTLEDVWRLKSEKRVFLYGMLKDASRRVFLKIVWEETYR